ncbi:hypothetical protein DIC66_09650 [Rhodoferax lacus]|uniref:Uncharacterized protein n=1 Tax=Rhodoferax lacus TaxID=2184758 RepID=A0A3E1RDD9_9BURK|nr:hypothetical protein [Rhodoferax lacus]RFO97375.1 hypothetical protein DIC66_09650 [Rhodoferax lacus]
MTTANINRFIQHLCSAFEALGAQVPMERAEHMAVLVHSAMESPRRRYHVSDHALYMCEGMAPRQVLAAIFHDVIYVQLDDGIAPHLAELLTPIISRQGQELVLLKTGADDYGLQLCLDLFGFKPGQLLTLAGGLNEFLSAAVAVQLLQPWLKPSDLLAVVASIEATVPFRPLQVDGQDCSMVLAARVRAQACRVMGLAEGAVLDDLVHAVMCDAVAIANRDLGSFAEPDAGKFVAATWLLIEESNAPLAAVGSYTLKDYREALTRMQVFLDGLEAAHVFRHFGGIPEAQTYARMTSTAAANVGFASVLLQLKIMSVTLIEALALQSGGDGPVSMFLGDLSAAGGKPERIDDYLPACKGATGLDPLLLQLMEQGRPQDPRSDLTVSPLTAYIYRCLGPEGCASVMAQARRMANGELSAHALLRTLPAPMLEGIIDACARIAVSRRERLQGLKAELLATPAAAPTHLARPAP